MKRYPRLTRAGNRRQAIQGICSNERSSSHSAGGKPFDSLRTPSLGNKAQILDLSTELCRLEQKIGGDLDDDSLEWQPTADNTNTLPEPLRRYIHEVVSCDPGYMVQENIILRQQVDGRTVMVDALKRVAKKKADQSTRKPIT
jgi:hypothetical protein